MIAIAGLVFIIAMIALSIWIQSQTWARTRESLVGLPRSIRRRYAMNMMEKAALSIMFLTVALSLTLWAYISLTY